MEQRRGFLLNKKSFIWSVVLGLFLFQDALQFRIGFFGYFDELVAIGFFGYYFAHATIGRRHDRKIILYAGIMLLIGFLGVWRSGLQTSFKYQIFDAFNVLKYLFVVLGASRYFNKYKYKESLVHYLANIVKVTILISSVFMVMNLFTDIGMSTDYRFGFRSFNFVFSRVGGMYSACIIMLLIMTAEMYYRNRRSNKIYICLIIINMCSTLRSRPVGFAIIYIVLCYMFLIRKDKGFKWWYLVPTAGVLWAIAQEQFEFYFSGDRARNVLLRYGIQTAKDYFPLGSGFSTYGTAVARDTYASLYSKYGFSNYYGLSQEYGDFLTDNYWPAIIGEFGFIGAFLNMLLLIATFMKLYRHSNNNYSKICVMFLYATLAISSLASSSFFACSQFITFLCVVLVL